MSDFKAAMRDRVLVFDGAMGTYLQGFGLKPGDFDGHEGLNEILSISRPDIIKKVHLDYLEAGADVVETNTFGANAAVLAEYGLEGRVTEFNLAAARLAREAADKFSAAKPRFVAGSIGPTNKALFVTGGMSFDDMRALYLDQMLALIEGGVDLLMVETAHDAVNLRAALAAARLAFAKSGRELPVIASATMDGKSKMLSGHDSDSFYAAAGHFPLAAIGFNCSSGPEGMRPRLERLAARAHFPTLVMPNAGLPDENGVYSQTPEKFSALMGGFASAGLLNLAGGCCGTGPAHIKALAAAVKGVRPRAPKAEEPWVISGTEALFFDEIEPPAMAGERNNSIGSKKFRDMVAAGDRAGGGLGAGQGQRDELADVKDLFPALARA
ncbi:MAG TPA: homocysteine S-methyltransferase family protein, partial [Elusimicrobiales bacterium]|nr:homocysteine S-methyltransferase family protein [Elusimicrobiales bacterium]